MNLLTNKIILDKSLIIKSNKKHVQGNEQIVNNSIANFLYNLCVSVDRVDH